MKLKLDFTCQKFFEEEIMKPVNIYKNNPLLAQTNAQKFESIPTQVEAEEDEILYRIRRKTPRTQ